MLEEKLISVCIPVYNGEKYIEETLNSISDQTYKNIEIIISDNASTDNTGTIVMKYLDKDTRIQYSRNEVNLGYSGNLNKLIDLAQSEYIAIFHADDIYQPTIIEEQVIFLDNNPSLGGCFTLGKSIDSSGKQIKSDFIYNSSNLQADLIVDSKFYITRLFEIGTIFICPTSMIKKSVYQELNGYSLTVKYVEDVDMWARILEKYNLGIIAKELFSYRIHNNQASSYYISSHRKDLTVLLKYLDDYLQKHPKYREKYKDMIYERIAYDYIKVAKYSIFSNDYQNYKRCILESRKYKSNLKNFNKKMIQTANPCISFTLRRIALLLANLIGIKKYE